MGVQISELSLNAKDFLNYLRGLSENYSRAVAVTTDDNIAKEIEQNVPLLLLSDDFEIATFLIGSKQGTVRFIGVVMLYRKEKGLVLSRRIAVERLVQKFIEEFERDGCSSFDVFTIID